MGHLLNDQCKLAGDCTITAWLLTGAHLEVALDNETQFPLFRPEAGLASTDTNALLLTIRPHEDFRATLEDVCAEAGFANARVYGIGSMIGAGFLDAPPMKTTLSEVLLLKGCDVQNGVCTRLPLVCVDPMGAIYEGELAKGKGSVLVTFESLVLAA